MGNLVVVVGGQAGSEGKGAVAGYLSRPDRLGDGLAIRVGGPNAGHSAVDPQGRKWALRQLPVAAVTSDVANLAIAAGSEVNLEVLREEIEQTEAAGHRVKHRLFIDPAATILDQHHIDQETKAALTDRIGSTGKGIGAARADRIMRRAITVRDMQQTITEVCSIGRVDKLARDVLRNGDVLVEGTQGYQLGLHTDNYPQTTSGDCRAIDMLAQAGVMPWHRHIRYLDIWLVFRAYPIRVAGNSGPLPGETNWQELRLPEELTTVTKKVRRVGRWDNGWAREALLANGYPNDNIHCALTMLDQIDPTCTGLTDSTALEKCVEAMKFVEDVENELGIEFEMLGTSDRTIVDYLP